MTKDELLIKIKQERPHQIINDVITFTENEYGFYDVEVDMEITFFGSKISHHRIILPYPIEEYEKLTPQQKWNWDWYNTKHE